MQTQSTKGGRAIPVSSIPTKTAAATNQQVSAVPVYSTLNTPPPNPSEVGPDDDVEIGLVQPTTQTAQTIKKEHTGMHFPSIVKVSVSTCTTK